MWSAGAVPCIVAVQLVLIAGCPSKSDPQTHDDVPAKTDSFSPEHQVRYTTASFAENGLYVGTATISIEWLSKAWSDPAETPFASQCTRSESATIRLTWSDGECDPLDPTCTTETILD